jgi:hypothetical protein
MIIEVPFFSEVVYVPPKARNPRRVFVRDTVPLEIMEIEPSELPLVARVTERHSSQPAVDIRSNGGGTFYRNTYSSLATLVADLLDSERTPLRQAQQLWICRDIVPGDEIPANRIQKDERESRTAQLHARADELVICSGMVLERCPEPCWTSFGYGGLFEPTYAYPEKIKENPERLIRATRLDATTTFGGRPIECYGNIEIIDPSAFRLSLASVALRKAVEESIESIAKDYASHIRTLPVDKFAVYARQRDSVAAALPGEGDDVIEHVAREIAESNPDILGYRLNRALRDLDLEAGRVQRDPEIDL